MKKTRMASAIMEERWQAKRNTLLERNKYMFNNSLMSDIKFAFPDTKTTIPAHKYVLAISSPVFFAMFYGDLAENRDTINITDCEPDIFLHFLRFIYCDEANFQDVDCVIKLWCLGEQYDIPSLARKCVEILDGSMDPLSAFRVISYAKQFNDEVMEIACWEVIDYNAQTIVDDDSFLDVNPEMLLSFVQRSSLHVEEERLFDAIDRWAAKRCEKASMAVNGTNKRSLLGEVLLKNIRFPVMSPHQFTVVVLPKNILTKDEIICVFKRFYSNYESYDSFDFSIIPRAPNTSIRSFRTSPNAPTNCQLVTDSEMLTFVTSEPILLCGLVFLFEPTETQGSVTFSLWRQGVRIKHLTAKSRVDSWNADAVCGENKAFFNRPVSLDPETCYTIEVLEASSHSSGYHVANTSSGFFQYPEESNPTGSTTSSETEVTLRFCEGLVAHEIPLDRPYFGHIENILFQHND